MAAAGGRFDRLEDAFVTVVELLKRHDERMTKLEDLHEEARRDAQYTQRIWVAFAQHFGLPPEMWQDDLA